MIIYHDNETEVIATCLEDLTILDGKTGTVEINKTLPFLFDGGNLAVVDFASNGSEYILSDSFYGNLYLFSPTIVTGLILFVLVLMLFLKFIPRLSS